MLDFTEGRIDVLVATMIIESGIDIPTVNALIVDRADTLGLAQLYQPAAVSAAARTARTPT